MNHDDQAALIEVKDQLEALRAQQGEAQRTSDWVEAKKLQAMIDVTEAKRLEIIRRTEPEDVPKL